MSAPAACAGSVSPTHRRCGRSRSGAFSTPPRAIERRGRFLIVLAGGSTPRGIYRMLRAADADGSRWQVYFGDERCLPADDGERNSAMAANAWLDHVPSPRARRRHGPR